MRFIYPLIVLPLAAFFFSISTCAQTNTYILNGSSQQNSCNCYSLTPASNTLSGSVWNANMIDLRNEFDFTFNVYLGCADASGADGIVFMLQPISTSLGTTGEGMGFEGVTPSIGITIDTWQNLNRNDPSFDHISIQENGNPTHGTDLAGPTQASAASENIEDCQWHLFRISWNPGTKQLQAYFDGSLRVGAQYDIIASVFKNDPLVYWGFSAATGGANNLQQFCTALNPKFTTSFSGNGSCAGNAVVFQSQSESFAPIAGYLWEYGDGATSTDADPSPHLYSQPGIYQSKLTITGLDGCISEPATATIFIGDKPIADFEVYDTCSNNISRIIDRSFVNIGDISQWEWMVNGSPVSNSQQPQLTNLPAGSHQLQLKVKSSYGCPSDVVIKTLILKDIPVINARINNGCVEEPLGFFAEQVDNLTSITQWNWQFGDGQTSQLQNPAHTFIKTGLYNTQLSAVAGNGCTSATVTKSILIKKPLAFAGNDTIVLRNVPFQLQGSGGVTYLWMPITGLNDPTIADPFSVLQNDITYVLTVITAEGCTDTDSIKVQVFKGSAIYVPSGFTPNRDGLNEILKPLYIGIKHLHYFTVYNRWGQIVFTTNNIGRGWDGTFNGKELSMGSFVWILKAEDIVGKVYQMKGTVTIIK